MKVLLINGSPKVAGNTYGACQIVSDQLKNQGISTEIYNLGDKNIKPCTACRTCNKLSNNTCVIDDDLNDLVLKCLDADGIVLASPVHYADISSMMKVCLDRLFVVSGANGNFFRHKVGAAVAVVRRTGGMHTFNSLNTYFTYSEMFIVGSSYWSVIHGHTPDEVYKDEEGVITLQVMANNMAYLLQTISESKVNKPEKTNKVWTNFVRDDL